MYIDRLDSNRLTIKAPAKLNLFLEVLNKRPDGFHNINSLFQAVSLFDQLTFTVSDKPGVTIELVAKADLTVGEDNLISRAYTIMRDEFDLSRGLHVRLDKHIPIAAGLGGGSADGAATLLACNTLFDLGLTQDQISQLALKIGSDLPFFFSAGQAMIGGRGEKVKTTHLPTDYHLVLVKPALEVSTAEAYALLKRDLTKPNDQYTLPPCRDVKSLVEALRLTGNDFEDVLGAFCPELGQIRDMLLNAGAVLARLSGSGPTVFGLFEGAPETGQKVKLNGGNWQLFAVKPITWPDRVV
ncbi:MAG: 4-(cytidine 5'-diphospho)-2-C-methyl-D-erythritol kinase [candidate division Zixibacteria bacterium]|nr:4-(cytidine 5'-diphospho)-2-C-methyl-D-erythritol kinase [candidate division Zixibacteria bacterium]MDH3936853.1 4-(cytidine 5'-diphospho)-2-C-methyl-D-erythritol kinase [candidate division Zixibacteria bacterium]MDH4035478.1 4-(cytidine 5'-diphospho)-2-C-methyl-D-erythritol kinase [candidate division Zixibacteria bacterium]